MLMQKRMFIAPLAIGQAQAKASLQSTSHPFPSRPAPLLPHRAVLSLGRASSLVQGSGTLGPPGLLSPPP